MPRELRPLAHEVALEVGDLVWWDDREGWRGRITAIHDDGTLAVTYDNGESDDPIRPMMFTTTRRDG